MGRASSIVKEGVHFKRQPFDRECPSCKEKFDNPVGFLIHWSCYKKSEFYKKRKDGSESWGCFKCPKKFTRFIDLHRHAAIHHAEKNLECLKCHRMFASQRTVHRHNCYRHLRLDRSMPKVINSKYVEGVHYKRRPFLKECKDCRQSFADPVDYISHDKCTKQRLYFRKDKTGKYQCEWPGCASEVGFISNLKTHFSTHAEKNIECLVCHKRYGYFDGFTDHFRKCHNLQSAIQHIPIKINKHERQAKKTVFESIISLGRAIESMKAVID